ncbi:MAG TPA: hypothetical protein VIP05_35225 [Burkholderiaceae bacterium]
MWFVQVWRKAYGAAIDDGDRATPWLPLRRQTPGNAAHGADRTVNRPFGAGGLSD